MKLGYSIATSAVLVLLIQPVTATGSPAATDAEATDDPQRETDSQVDAPPPPPDDEGVDDTSGPVAPPDENTSLCEQVTCSNHGVCVLLGGQPSCACNEGYVPDSVNGLNCVSPPPPPLAPVGTTAAPNAAADSIDPSTQAVSALFPGFPTERVYQRYLWRRKVGRFYGSFPDFVALVFKKKKRRGVALLSTAGGLTATTALFFGFGIAESIKARDSNDDCWAEDINGEWYNQCESSRNAFYIFGSIFAAGATALYIVGGVVLRRVRSRLRRLRPLQDSLSSDGALSGRIDVTPYWEPGSDLHGVAARIHF